MPSKSLFTYAFLLIYIAFTIIIFFIYVPSALDGHSKIELFADSETFEEIALGESNYEFSSIYEAIGVKFNFVGPLIVLYIFQMNRVAILFFNLTLFLLGLYFLNKSRCFNMLKLVVLLGINPIVFSSLLSVNKEIFVYLSLCLLVRYFYRPTIILAILIISLSVLARWQFTICIIMIMMMYSKYNPLKRYPLLSIFISILVISVFYHRIKIFSEVNMFIELLLNNSSDSIFGRMSMFQLNSDIGYLTVVIPKAIHLMFGIIKNYNEFLHWQEFYNDVLTYLFGISMVCVFIYLILSKKFPLGVNNGIDLSWIIYIVIFSISPIYTPRYFVAVYILWAIKLSLTKYGLLKLIDTYKCGHECIFYTKKGVKFGYVR